MISSVPGVAFKFFKNNRAISIPSIISVMISMTLIITLFMFITGAEKTLENEIEQLYGNADMQISYSPQSNDRLKKEVIESIREMENVRQLSSVMIGRTLVGKEDIEVYTVGLDDGLLSKGRYHYSHNLGPNDVIMNQGLAENLGIRIGDSVLINKKEYQLVEIFSDINQASTMPDALFISISNLKNIMDANYDATYLMIELVNPEGVYEFVNQFNNVYPGLEIDLFQENEVVKANLESLKMFIIVFSVLIVIMCGCFIIANFQTFLYTYRKQFAVIRSIGGTSSQTFLLVLLQSTMINVVGILLGIFCSFVSYKFLIGFLVDRLSIGNSDITFNFGNACLIGLLGFIVIEFFMLLPALRTSKVLPLKIARDNEKLESGGKWGKVISSVGLGISMFLFVMGLVSASYGVNGIGYGIVSAILFVLCSCRMFTYYIKEIMNLLLPLFQRLGGRIALVAVKNLIPQVRKNSIVIISLSITILTSMWGGTFFKTLSQNDEKYLRSQFALDLVITERGKPGQKTLGEEFKTELEQLPGIEASVRLSENGGMYIRNKDAVEYFTYCFADLKTLFDIGVVDELSGNSGSYGMVIAESFASRYNLKINDTIQVAIPNEPQGKSSVDFEQRVFDSLNISGIIDSIPARPGAEVFMDYRYESQYGTEFTGLYKVLVEVSNEEEALQQLELLKRHHPQIKWTTLEQALNDSAKLIFQRWFLFIAVVLTVLFSLVMGVVNTLMNSIQIKRKEYAILRTFGIQKKGMVIIILSQISIYIMLGVIFGIGLGVVTSNIIFLTESLSFPRVDFGLPFIMSGVVLLVCFLLFVPFSISFANTPIVKELRLEER